jgi:hypothetical protein
MRHNAPVRARTAPAVVALAAAALACGCAGGARGRPERGAPPAAGVPSATATDGGTPYFVDDREVGRPTRADFQEFNRAWALFVRRDPGWPAARDRWLARGGAAPYVLSENLLRYFWSATAYGRRDDIDYVAANAKAAGEPAVGYFANFLILESWPLKEPVAIRTSDGTRRTVTRFDNDDVTRQHLTIVLSTIGKPAVARLLTPPFLRSGTPSARRYVMYTLGRIGTDEAVDGLAGMLSEPDWQDRASAVKALGFALFSNPRAKEPLLRAKADADPFVRKKAAEALQGRARGEF